MRKSILLIGGTRFFGRIVVKKMIDLGWSVTLLTRGNRSPEIDHPNLSVLMGDRRDETSMWKLLKDKNFDAVVDNICYEPQDADAVLRILKSQCGCYLFSSTVMTYLNAFLTDRPLFENVWEDCCSVQGMEVQYSEKEIQYAISKRACELKVLNQDEIATVVFRLHNVVGREDFSGKSAAIPEALLSFGELRICGHEGDTYQQICADDLGLLYCEAIEKNFTTGTRVFNVASSSILMTDYIDILAESLGVDAKVVFSDIEDALNPFPRNVLLDCTKLEENFSTRISDYNEFLPQIARSCVERRRLESQTV